MHLKQVVRPQEQIQLYADIAEGAKTYAAKQARNRKSNFKKILTYNWERDAAKVPDSFEFFSALACKEASTVCSTIPPAFKPNYVTAFCYPQKDGRLRGRRFINSHTTYIITQVTWTRCLVGLSYSRLGARVSFG